MKTKAKLRLASNTFVAPVDDGWIVRRGSDPISVIDLDIANLPDGLLELLDGTQDSVDLARSTGVGVDQINAVLRRLRRHQLLQNIASSSERAIRRWRWEAINQRHDIVAPRARADVMLFGLGALGLAVLQSFLELKLGSLFICDPSLVGADIPECFDESDRGQPRQQAVLHHLGPALRARVSTIAIDGSNIESIDASIEDMVSKATVAIACSDCASLLAEKAAHACRRNQIPFIGAELTAAGAYIGHQLADVQPLPDDSCCCCERMYRRSGDRFESALGHYVRRLFPIAPPWRYPHDVTALTTLSNIVLLEMLAALGAAQHTIRVARPRHVFVDFSNNNISARNIPRHYACSVCNPRRAADIQSLREDAYRQWTDSRCENIDPPSLADLWCVLQRFVDPGHGFFQYVERTTGADRQRLAAIFADRGVRAPNAPMIQAHRAMAHRHVVRNGRRSTVTTHGLTFDDPRAAEALAILEGIERLFGLEHCDPRRVVTAAYADIESIALDPHTFPLYASFQYEDPAFKLHRFDRLVKMEWVWGVRVRDGEPQLVPRDLIFGPGSGLPIYMANSSGAACHSSFLRAILNGLYENIERDALMVAWFNRLSLPRVTMTSDDRDPWQLRESFAMLGFRLTHVDITNDLGIPVVVAAVEDERDKNFFMLTMATAPTGELLLEKLYKELFHFCYPLLVHGDEYRTDVSRARDPLRVVTMADHACFYQNRWKIRHTSFLTSSIDEEPFGSLQLPCEPYMPQEELRILVERLHRRGYEVIVVDCSSPALRQVGLHVVKVLVPGLQPLHAGHRYRVLGGPRVFRVARVMGHADRDRTVEDLNPWPHPYW